MVAPKKKKPVKDGQGSKKPTFYAQKTVMIMNKQPVFEVFRRFGDGLETSVCKLYPDNLTNPTKLYDTDARLVYDSTSGLIEVPGMAVDAIKQKIAELCRPSPQTPPQSPKPATAQAKPYVPEQYQKPVAKPVTQPPSPPPKPASPSVNYQKLYEETLNQLETTQTDLEAADSRAEELESKLAGKTAKVGTLEKRLEEAKKSATGISQADLDAKIKELSEGYDDEIQNIRNLYADFASGDCIRVKKGKVEIKIYSEAKGKDFWIHQRKDGKFAYTSKDGKDVIYTPTTDITNYFVFAEPIANLHKKIKSLEKKQVKGETVEDLEEKLRLSEEHCDDLIEEKRNAPSKHARKWLAAAASSSPVSMAIGYLVEKAHLFENLIRSYLPSVSWLADYADKLHQADNNSGAVGGLVAGLIGIYAAYKIWMAGEKSVEQKAEPVLVWEPIEPVPAAEMPKKLPVAPPVQAPKPAPEAAKTYSLGEPITDDNFSEVE